MQLDEGDQPTANQLQSRPAPDMVAAFVSALHDGCQRYNATQPHKRYELCQLSETSGMIRFKNLYCQYDLSGERHLHLQLSIGWHGLGFHLMTAPDLTFVLVRNQWRESDNPMLCFDSSLDLAMFCLNELRHYSECPAAHPYLRLANRSNAFNQNR